MVFSTRVCRAAAVIALVLAFAVPGIPARGLATGRKLRDATANVASQAQAFGTPSWFNNWQPSFAGAKGQASAKGDQEAYAATETEATVEEDYYNPEWYCKHICEAPSSPTTAKALSEAFAAGKDSAIAQAASEAIALAGGRCCDKLATAVAAAKSFAQSTGKEGAFAESASAAYASVDGCAKGALAQAASLSESQATDGTSFAGGKATGAAQGQNAYTQTQTTSNVHRGGASSSARSVAVANGGK